VALGVSSHAFGRGGGDDRRAPVATECRWRRRADTRPGGRDGTVLPDEAVALSVAERHTPRKFSFDCAKEDALTDDIDDLLRLVGRQQMSELLEKQAPEEE
jgi:hypothetical protein